MARSNRTGGIVSKKSRDGASVARALRIASDYGCERLEDRRLLSGTWTTLTNAVPASDGAQMGMVLSDGTVMVHGGGGGAAATWYKLTPSNGNYVSGTWSTLHSMSLGRLYFASEVLPSGNVMVLGGEYASSGSEVNSGEIYNPVSNSWSAMATFPQSNFADDPSEMTPNGQVLAGYLFGGQTYLYNPASNSWAATTGSKLRGDRSDEETWVRLPDDSILSYDVFSSISTGTPHAQRYIPSTGMWVDAGTPPAQLSAPSVGYELGGGLLLPDGRVLFIGATGGRTAYYTPSTNAWTAGPNVPGNYVAADAPCAMMPNGDVLMAVSPEGGLNSSGNYTFPGPTKVYELNPTTNAYTDVTPSLSGFSLSSNTYTMTMTVLPSGQVMYMNDSGKVAIFTPTGSPNSAWAPTITNINNDSGSNVFTLSGYQLNGISEGASYGDDNEMSSNYPIIKLQDQAGNITFARTFNWSLNGVSSGYSTVNFTLPGSPGAYLVTVIANGIASQPTLDLMCGSNDGENWIAQPNSNTNYVDLNLIGSGVVATFYIGAFNQFIITGDAASNTEVINCNLFGRPTTLNGGDGFDYLRVENNGTGTVTEYGGNGDDYFDFDFYSDNLNTTQNFSYVYGGAGTNNVFTYDNNNTALATYSVTSAEVNRTGFGGYFYGADIQGVTLNTGTATDTTNITSTYAGTPFYLYAHASQTVNIGSSGSVQSVGAPIYLSDPPAYLTINIDDSADASARTTVMSTYLDASNASWGSITGLAPQSINYKYGDTNAVSVTTGTSTANVDDIQNDGYGTTTFHVASGGAAAVNVGNSTNGSQGILGTLVLDAASGTQTVTVDDSADGTARTAYLDFTTVNGYSSQRIYGLQPAYIEMYFSGTSALTVKTSHAGGSVTNILQDAISNTYIIGSSSTLVAHDAVVLGNAGSLVDLDYPITVTNPPGYTDVTVNDSADARSVGFTESSFVQSSALWGKLVFPTYTAFGSLIFSDYVTFPHADVTNLTVVTGTSATVAVQDTATNTAVNASGASLVVNVQGTTYPLNINPYNSSAATWAVNVSNAGSAQNVTGPIAISYTNAFGTLTVDDSADTVGRTVSMSDTVIAGLAPATITYPSYSKYNVSGGSGGNSYTVSGTPQGIASSTVDTLNAGTGNDTINVNSTIGNSIAAGPLLINTQTGNDAVTLGTGSLNNIQAPVTVSGGGGTDTVVLNDQSQAGTDTYTVTSTTVARTGFTTYASVGLTYSGLASLTLNGESGNNTFNVSSTAAGTPVFLNAGGGTDIINVFQTAATAPVTILPSVGNDAVNVDTTGTPGATAVFAASQQIGVLTVGNNGRAIEAAGGPRLLLQTASVSTTGNGALDVNGNDLTANASTLTAVTALAKQGLNLAGGGTWQGPGIDSSRAANAGHLTALGVVQNNQGGTPLFSSTNLFNGYAPAATEVLTRYTWYGDSNLDGKVDGSDYTHIDNGYLIDKIIPGTVTGWYNGDFNYDGVIDGSDYTLIDNSYNRQTTALPSAIVAAAAPPPASHFSTQPVTTASAQPPVDSLAVDTTAAEELKRKQAGRRDFLN